MGLSSPGLSLVLVGNTISAPEKAGTSQAGPRSQDAPHRRLPTSCQETGRVPGDM